MPQLVCAGVLATMKDVLAVVGSICMLLVALGGLWIAWRRFTREKAKEEVSAAEALVRLTARVGVLETWRTDTTTEHDALRAASDQGLAALQAEISAVQEQTHNIERHCERHKITLQADALDEIKQSIRRINTRCDGLKDKIDEARERADDRFVMASQHDKDLVAQAQTLDVLQQHVNNLAALVTKALNGRSRRGEGDR